MAIIKRNPNLPDYFVEVPGVRVSSASASIQSIVSQYEDAKVLSFPDLKPEIDGDFWGSLDTTSFPALKKLVTVSSLENDPKRDAEDQIRRIQKAGIETKIATAVSRQMSSVLDQVLPVYRKLFAGYRFTRGQVTWRLNEIYAENLHIDTYREPLPNHFARMFINLDTQPRIWHTSWRAREIIRIAKDRISTRDFEKLSPNDLWGAINRSVFGKTTKEWWDDQPRHIAFFHPGDIWAVDSRLVAHQIFYGRRAVSIDFFVDPESMLSREKHYLRLAESARADALAA
jgi:hypothetical protein